MQLNDDLQITNGVPGEPINRIILLVGSDSKQQYGNLNTSFSPLQT